MFTIIGLALFGYVNAAQLEQLRVSTDAQKTRLVFDLSDTATYKSFTLKNPDRLVVDFQKSRVAKSFAPSASESPLLRNVRFAERNDGSVRVVLDLTAAVSEKSFTLAPKGSEGHRVVMDLSSDAIVAEAPKKVAEPKKELRDVVVAVDAGHGGKDPGAIGLRGKAHEKRVTLQIARRVKRLIDAQPGMRAVLVRNGDYYIPLRKRTQIARKHDADLFVSIHADAFHKSHVHGASVFVVSNRGASSEMARWLANRENASDLAGGVAISDVSDDVAKTLLDLSRTGSQEASYKAAEKVHKELV
ncbi:MAG: N-acetylmuramoyl-L-alanine amidase, partial [Sedimenticolaceae bacterium]